MNRLVVAQAASDPQQSSSLGDLPPELQEMIYAEWVKRFGVFHVKRYFTKGRVRKPFGSPAQWLVGVSSFDRNSPDSTTSMIIAGASKDLNANLSKPLLDRAVSSDLVKIVVHVKDFNFCNMIAFLNSLSDKQKDLIRNTTLPKLVGVIYIGVGDINSKRLGEWLRYCRIHNFKATYHIAARSDAEFGQHVHDLSTRMRDDEEVKKMLQAWRARWTLGQKVAKELTNMYREPAD